MKQEIFVWSNTFGDTLFMYLQDISKGHRIDHVIDDTRENYGITRAIIIATKIEKP